jgi:transforming growth factor-beta-induced protein
MGFIHLSNALFLYPSTPIHFGGIPMKKLLILSALVFAGSMAQAKTIVEIAAGDPNFSTLVTAVKAAGLMDVLNSAGPFTVFAPTNAAFAKVPADQLAAILNDKAKLTAILTYHVVAGKVLAADVVKMNGQKAKTVEGSEIMITVANGGVMVDKANVVQTDIMADNGVIHMIDSVILPGTNSMAADTKMVKKNTLVDVALGNPQFSTLVTALKAAGLVDVLNGPGPFTVFAPTNEAFDKLPPALLKSILSSPEKLKALLTYHVVAGKVPASEVVKLNGQSAATVQGGMVRIKVTPNGAVSLNSRAKVIAVDVMADNGIIHVIDRVLLPR